MSRVTILTDFGTRDGYVAAMKGVIASMAPGVPIDDVTHDIPQGDVHSAAWTLSRYWSRYPRGTVHLVVVDPGVGTERRALAASVDGRFIVAPDNGVGTLAFAQARQFTAVHVQNQRYVAAEPSATFQGRDVFAPIAAHLARGVALEELGPSLPDPVRLVLPSRVRAGSDVWGEVVVIDRFGNAVTDVSADWLGSGARVEVGELVLELRRTYAEVPPGEPVAVINSDNLLEIAIRDGRADERLGVRVGDTVRVSGVTPHSPASVGRPPSDSSGGAAPR